MGIYFCWKCKTKDHYANEACVKDAATQATVCPDDRGVESPSNTRRVVAAPIKEVEEFLRKVGRPRLHADRKVYMRDLMRRKREKARTGS